MFRFGSTLPCSAMASDPADRFESMEQLIDELDLCFGELGSDDEATRIVRAPRRPRATRPRRRLPVIPFLLILLAAAAVAGGAYLFFSDSPTVPVVAEDNPSGPVRLAGSGCLRPSHGRRARQRAGAGATAQRSGDRLAHRGVPRLHQGRRRPRAARPEGGRPPRLATDSSRARLQGEGPGGEGSPSGPFENVSGEQDVVGDVTTFDADTKDQGYRYYVVWLRLPREGGQAHIYEVTART